MADIFQSKITDLKSKEIVKLDTAKEIEQHLEEAWESMHSKMIEILKAQELNYYNAIKEYLRKKELEIVSVTNELSHKAATADYKEILIEKLQKTVSRLENEGS